MRAPKPHQWLQLTASLRLIFSISQVDLILHFYSPVMPFHLFLLRHAETEPQQSGQSDFDRELLPKGFEQIGHIAQHLTKIGFSPDTIICSSARRAKTTAMTLIELLKMPLNKVQFNTSIYTAEANGLLDLIHETDDHSQGLLVIGHNPALSDLATYLVKGFADG
ncbi:MAG TPA: histidine phosphatase family protein, partial [Cyclobacteriaceae bacterium]